VINNVSNESGASNDLEATVPINVAIVEDDEEIRANLTHRINGNAAFRLVRTFADGEAGWRNCRSARRTLC
jgi:DNA-binding NarL/FixJ family response regulator